MSVLTDIVKSKYKKIPAIQLTVMLGQEYKLTCGATRLDE